MTDRELLEQALEVLTSVAITKRSGVSDNGSAFLPFEVLIECADMVSALRTRLAQPEPEPVAWMHNFIDYVITKNRPTDITRNAGRWTPLYTAPPAKEWAGLTDDEYELMAEKRVTNYFFNTLDYAHDIEAMLKEKNT